MSRGGCRDFQKGVLYVGHHGWPAKKILGFRCSKKAEITLETTSFWQNISIAYGALLMIYMHLLMNYAVCSSSKGWGGGGGWGAPTAPPPESASDVNYVTNKTCTVTNTIFWGFFLGESWISKLIDLLFNIEFGIRPIFFLSFFVSSLMISCISLNVSWMFLHLFTK